MNLKLKLFLPFLSLSLIISHLTSFNCLPSAALRSLSGARFIIPASDFNQIHVGAAFLFKFPLRVCVCEERFLSAVRGLKLH